MGAIIRSQSVLRWPFGWNGFSLNIAVTFFNYRFSKKTVHTYLTFVALCSKDGFFMPVNNWKMRFKQEH